MTCALKLGLVLSGHSSLIQCAVSFLGLRRHPLPVPLNSAQRLTWRDSQPRYVERERKREIRCWQAGEAQHLPTESVSTQPCGGAGVSGRWGEGTLWGQSFCKRGSLSHYQQSGAKTGPLRSSHREVAKAPFFHGFVVLDFQIILIFRNCGLFCVQMYFSELRVDTWNH